MYIYIYVLALILSKSTGSVHVEQANKTMCLYCCTQSEPPRKLSGPNGTIKDLYRLLGILVELQRLSKNLQGHWGTFVEPLGASDDLQGSFGVVGDLRGTFGHLRGSLGPFWEPPENQREPSPTDVGCRNCSLTPSPRRKLWFDTICILCHDYANEIGLDTKMNARDPKRRLTECPMQ